MWREDLWEGLVDACVYASRGNATISAAMVALQAEIESLGGVVDGPWSRRRGLS